MVLERTHFRVEVSDTSKDRNYWASKLGLSVDTVAAIRASDIILTPWEDRAGAEVPSFPTGTGEFYRALQKGMLGGQLALASEPEAYRELALHANEARWPSIFVRWIAVPILINLLSSQIFALMTEPVPPKTIELNLTIENTEGKCIVIAYKGEPSRLIETLVNEAKRCFPQENSVKIDESLKKVSDTE